MSEPLCGQTVEPARRRQQPVTVLPDYARLSGNDSPRWKVLIVDDEEEIHVVTRLALQDFNFADRELEFISAYNAEQAREQLQQVPDIAIVLLDVVMDSDDAGLKVARFIREQLGNHFVRIILRTGQPGIAPERQVLREYDINDYRAKTELTQDRLYSVIYTALSSYKDMIALARSRHQLVGLVNQIEQLSYLAARDLQMPLMDVMHSKKVIALGREPGLSEEFKQTLSTMFANLDQVNSGVHKLVALTSAGRFNEAMENIDCAAVLSCVLVNLRGEFEHSRARLSYDELPVVHGSQRQLIQLFQNLIGNAIRYRREVPPEIHISARLSERNWLFSVSDNGVGIEPQDHLNLFNLFRRDGIGEMPRSGGVGLPICEKIVRWHGGRIWVESEPGQGTTFMFTLPLPA